MSANRMFTLVTALACAASLTAACAGGDSRGGSGGHESSASTASALAVVVGPHANSPHPAMVARVGALIDTAVDDGSQASIVINDGKPVLKGPVSLAPAGNNPDARKRSKQMLTAQFRAKVDGMRAAAAESDLLGAVTLAARAMPAGDAQRTLVVIDSGLQTVAPLRFQDAGVLTADPADVAEALAAADALPTLSGVHVVLSGIGDTTDPQEALTQAQRENLVAIWVAVLRRAGADVTVFDEPLTSPPTQGAPAVTSVPLPPLQSFAAVDQDGTATVDLGQETVAFLPNQAVYRDRNAVEQALRPLAEKIIAAHLLLTLTGTTAGRSDGRALSLQRAEAVQATLTALGVDPQVITCAGVGSNWPGHIPDTDANGHLLPGPAAQNRKVVVDLRRA